MTESASIIEEIIKRFKELTGNKLGFIYLGFCDGYGRWKYGFNSNINTPEAIGHLEAGKQFLLEKEFRHRGKRVIHD